MKNWIVLIAVIFGTCGLVMAQDAQEVTKSGKQTRVSGVDPMGAQVTVVYDENRTKVYQERTLNGETTYAYFADGGVTEYGTVVKPALVTSEIRSNETDEP